MYQVIVDGVTSYRHRAIFNSFFDISKDGVRESNNLSEALHTATDYDRLLLSLICPLPNEQDFAINVCNLISNEGRYTIKLAKCPLLIDFLLAHTGLYRDASLKSLFSDIYGHVRPHSLNSFWFDVLENLEYFDLADNGYSLAHGGDVGSDDEFEENNNICFNDIGMIFFICLLSFENFKIFAVFKPFLKFWLS